MSHPRIGTLLERHLFAIELSVASALAVGSGQADRTDRDVLTDGLGRPYVPGSTLAGALYALVPQHADLFARTNPTDPAPEQEAARSSPLRVEHLLLAHSVLTQRASVALSDQRRVENRFDTELVEGGATGWLRLSLDIRLEREDLLHPDGERIPRLRNAWHALLAALLSTLDRKQFRIGARTRRGYGLLVPAACGANPTDRIRFDEDMPLGHDARCMPQSGHIRYARLALRFRNWPEGMNADARSGEFATPEKSRAIWKDFQWDALQRGTYDAVRGQDGLDPWLAPHVRALNGSSADPFLLRVAMRVNGSLLVRTYTTTAKGTDMAMQMGRDENGTEQALVPGTSLAGLFRQDFLRQARTAVAHGPFQGMRVTGEQLTDALFGTVSNEGALASGVLFSDGRVTGANPVTVMRVGIDPFTGGTKAGALFTETISHGGMLRFDIRMDPNRLRGLTSASEQAASPGHAVSGLPAELSVPEDWIRSCLLRTLMRLHLGMLVVGGEGGIGRGWLCVENKGDGGVWIQGKRLLPVAIQDATTPDMADAIRWTWKEMPA